MAVTRFYDFFPERRLSEEEEAMELRWRILDKVLLAEGVCLQFKRCFPERGALVMLCGNDETGDWLQGLAPGYKNQSTYSDK
ncbi:hypothetical protein J6590_057379 [Homalodisca vitripennis]|nr:hypothetical protein J6590_057379 [Homalodisca vitripennis]